MSKPDRFKNVFKNPIKMYLYHLCGLKKVKIDLKNTFLSQSETSQNQGLLKIKAKTLDNAYLTIVYLQPI
jgi:hypothetical protein